MKISRSTVHYLEKELLKAGLPVVSVREEGDVLIDFNRELTPQERKQADMILADCLARDSEIDQRAKEAREEIESTFQKYASRDLKHLSPVEKDELLTAFLMKNQL